MKDQYTLLLWQLEGPDCDSKVAISHVSSEKTTVPLMTSFFYRTRTRKNQEYSFLHTPSKNSLVGFALANYRPVS
jgi:hypothetical protein